jgi:hypothetical protein
VNRDQLYYGNSDPNNYGHHPRIRDAWHSLSLDACGPQAFAKKIRQTPFLALFCALPNITKYSRDTNPVVRLEDFCLTY